MTETASAGVIPYNNVGTPITIADYDFTAASTGPVGVFVGSSAGDTDYVALYGFVGGSWVDLTNSFCTGPSTTVNGDCFVFDNHAGIPEGTSQQLGMATVGEGLKFVGYNSATGAFLSSIASENSDGFNHFYATGVTAGQVYAGSPAGIYMSLEDLLASQGSDFDYNDDEYIFTNVGSPMVGVPEPGTLTVLGAVLAGLAGWRSRRKTKLPA